MIETIEELGKALRYRHTDETYDEVINRYSEIISDWHTTHTVMVFNLKELIRRWDDRTNDFTELDEKLCEFSANDMGALIIQCRDEMKKAMENKDYQPYDTRR